MYTSLTHFTPYSRLRGKCWGWVPFWVQSQSGLSSSRGWVQSGLSPSRGWVHLGFSPFGVQSHSGFSPIWGWVHSGFSPIRGSVHSGLSPIRGWVHSGFSPFEVHSIRGWVFLGSVFLGSVVLGSVGESKICLTAGQRYSDMRFFGFNWFSQKNPSELLISQLKFPILVQICWEIRIQGTPVYSANTNSFFIAHSQWTVCTISFHIFSVLYVKFHSVFSENTCSANLFQDLCNSAYSAKWHSFIPRVLYSIHTVAAIKHDRYIFDSPGFPLELGP